VQLKRPVNVCKISDKIFGADAEVSDLVIDMQLSRTVDLILDSVPGVVATLM
jgi:hypothetical protein